MDNISTENIGTRCVHANVGARRYGVGVATFKKMSKEANATLNIGRLQLHVLDRIDAWIDEQLDAKAESEKPTE